MEMNTVIEALELLLDALTQNSSTVTSAGNNYSDITNQIGKSFKDDSNLVETVLLKEKMDRDSRLSCRDISQKIYNQTGTYIRPCDVRKRLWDLQNLYNVDLEKTKATNGNYKLYRLA